MANKLSEYGHTFQIKSIACLMTDVGFMGQIYDILDEKHFDNDALKWIVKQCKEYYNEYKKPITLDVFKVKTSEIQGDILKTTIIETLKEVYRLVFDEIQIWSFVISKNLFQFFYHSSF